MVMLYVPISRLGFTHGNKTKLVNILSKPCVYRLECSNNFLLNITVDLNDVLYSLTHAVLILTWFVNFKINMYYALLHRLLCMYIVSNNHIL